MKQNYGNRDLRRRPALRKNRMDYRKKFQDRYSYCGCFCTTQRGNHETGKGYGYEIPNPIQFSLNFVDPCPGSVLVDDLDEFIPKLIKGLDIYAGTVTALNMKKGDKEKMSESYKGLKVDCMGNPVEPAPGTSMHRDPVGPDGPSGDNWKERLSREYHDTKVRYELLHIHNVEEIAKRAKETYDRSTHEQKSIRKLLFRQESIMREYLDVLEIRMAMAGLAI